MENNQYNLSQNGFFIKDLRMEKTTHTKPMMFLISRKTVFNSLITF
jgi:hypothetical protein